MKNISIKQGESLTIGFKFNDSYDESRIIDMLLYVDGTLIGSKSENTLQKTTYYTAKMSSDDTFVMNGYRDLILVLDDSILGIKKFIIAGIIFDRLSDRFHEDIKADGFYDLLLNLSIDEHTLTEESSLIDVIIGGSPSMTSREFSRWHPDGVIFSYGTVDSTIEDVVTINQILSYTGGYIYIHKWSIPKPITTIPYIPKLPPISIIDPTLEYPIFVLGEFSIRYIGSSRKKYIANSVNAKTITYSLDLDSISAGNTINIYTGEVTWNSTWLGDSVITAIATGLTDTLSSTHTVSTIEFDEDNPIYDYVDYIEQDITPTYRKVQVFANDIILDNDNLYYIMLKFPINEQDNIGTVVISNEYYREEIYEGYYNILMGVLNSVKNNRVLCMEWGSGGPPKPKPVKPTIYTRSFETARACQYETGTTHNTGIIRIWYKIQKSDGVNEDGSIKWIDMVFTDTGYKEPWYEDSENHSECPPYSIPPAPYRAGQYVGATLDINKIVDFDTLPSSSMDFDTLTASGRNFLYLSIPVGKTFRVLNGGDVITSKFSNTGIADNRDGFQNNIIWQQNPAFGTSLSCIYTITINI